VLTQAINWHWIFFVNLPIGIATAFFAVRLVEDREGIGLTAGADLPGAALITGGLMLLVYTIVKTSDYGWGSARTVGELIGAVVLLAAFVVIESVRSAPLMPLGIFRVRTLAGANVVGLLLGAVVFSNFFLLTLYVQQVLGYSALRTGITFLATAGTTVVVAGIAQALVTRVGVRPVLVAGLLLMTGGMFFYTQIPADGSYASNLLPGYLLVGFGLAGSFIPVSIAALAGVEERQAGLASGLINTAQQVGGAIGVAVAATIATSHASTLLDSGHTPAQAYTSGFALAFWVLGGLGIVGVLASLALVRGEAIATAEPVRIPA
jgi:MFS family permease